jgi:hypothetical protein
MQWRYQPVYIEEGDTKVYSLIEAWFDESDKLTSWTEECFMHPQGESADELRGDLTHMLACAWKWVPVRFSDLKVGMVFQRAILKEDSDNIADLIGAVGEQVRAKTRAIQ